MTPTGPLDFDQELSQLPLDRKERHEAFVALFGQYLFWLRNWSLRACRTFIESAESRENLGTVRRQYYEGIARLPPELREVAMLFVEEVLNGFAERLVWLLGDEGTDARLGKQHAYRFRLVMEIIDLETGEVVEAETINRGGRFFGSYWARWLNRYSSARAPDAPPAE